MATCLHRLLSVLSILLVVEIAVAAQSDNTGQQRQVLVISISGVINPVAAEFTSKSIKKAEEMGATALIIQLDTPGGLDTSMRSIVKDISASNVPVVVYVSPSGARAASAGAIITIAAHVAAMAPGTNIGAAHPVALGEKMDKIMAEKAANDAAAYVKSIAEHRGRNVKWAEEAVRKSISATETEALKLSIIDIVATDLTALLDQLDGRRVRLDHGERVVFTKSAKVVQEEIGLRHKVLNLISDPTVAYILMLLGFYGLFFELTNPGAVFPGVVGTISLILAFYSFQTLPVNYAGFLLIITGIILFLLEVKIASYGVLTIGGIVSLILGSLMLFDSPLPFFRLSLSIIMPAAAVTAAFFFVTFRLAYKAHIAKPSTGVEGLDGMEGTAKTEVNAAGGLVMVHGEVWSAYSEKEIPAGEAIVVESVKGLKVKVKKRG